MRAAPGSDEEKKPTPEGRTLKVEARPLRGRIHFWHIPRGGALFER